MGGAAPIVETGEKRRAFHNIQAEDPVENSLAMFGAAREFGPY